MRRVSSLLMSCALLCVIGCAASTVVAAETVTAVDQSDAEQVLGQCDAYADCYDGSVVSCTGASYCTYVDSSCPVQRGYVECDGVKTYCPSCPIEECVMDGKKCGSDANCRPSFLPECKYCVCSLMEASGSELASEAASIGLCLCP